MTTKIFTDRTRIEAYQKCKRLRLIGHHLYGTGIQPAKRNIYLAVGGSVHAGLATLLRQSQDIMNAQGWDASIFFGSLLPGNVEEQAVHAALADFAQYSGQLELDSNEIAAMTQPKADAAFQSDMIAQAQELGMSTEGLGVDRAWAMSQFDRMLYDEQAALVEGIVRGYARYPLRPLLEEFEVLEVEREGEWKLAEWEPSGGCSYSQLPQACELCGSRMGRGSYTYLTDGKTQCPNTSHDAVGRPVQEYNKELWFMSRPDALLRHRQTNQLHLLSFKTTGSWGDIRRLKAAEHDVQGLTEGVEVERRLASWWDICQGMDPMVELPHLKTTVEWDAAYAKNLGTTASMIKFLRSAPEPPRIYAIRYEYLLKGERREDKELSSRLGMTVRTQRSHLIQQYVAISTPQKGAGGYSLGDVCWSWDFLRPEDDKDSKLAWQNWKSFPVYREGGGVKAWIDKLAASETLMSGEDSTVGMEPRQLGWKSEAQKMGVTRKHPFEEVFPPPVIVIRQDDELRDVFEQIEAQERRVAEDVAQIDAQDKEEFPAHGERRSLINQKFPQHRHSCFYPTECWATRICYATDAAVQADPLGAGGGKFVRRVPNHPIESEHNKLG